MTTSNEHEFFDQLAAPVDPQAGPPAAEHGQHATAGHQSWAASIGRTEAVPDPGHQHGPPQREPDADNPDTGPIAVNAVRGPHQSPTQPQWAPQAPAVSNAPPWAGQPPQQPVNSHGYSPEQFNPAAAAQNPAWGWSSAAEPAAVGGHGLRDDLKAGDLLQSRKIPSSRGWRKWLYHASFRKINVGESPDEIELRTLLATIKSPLVGTHSVTVVGGKGGSGKTSVTSAVASTFADIRKKDPVLAADVDSAEAANLPDRIAPGSSATFADVVAGKQLRRNADLRNYMGQNTESGLDVLAGPARSGGTDELDGATYGQAHKLLELYYNLLFNDTGVAFRHPVMPAVLERTNTVVMVASDTVSGLSGAWIAMNWLEHAGYDALRTRMVVVINHNRAPEGRKDRKETANRVADMRDKYARKVSKDRIFELPYDRHIAEDGVLDLGELSKKSRRELLKIAAAIATGFGATTDGRR